MTSASAHAARPGRLVAPCDVLSIQIHTLGNFVYGSMLRRALADSPSIRLRAFWTNDRREWPARLVNRFLALRGPHVLARRNLDFRRIRAELGYALFGRRLVQRELAAHHVDVLHFHTQTPALLSADLMRRVPTVITTDGTAMRNAAEGERAWRWTHAPNVLLERRVLRAAAAVVVFSEYSRRQMVDEHGLAPERVFIIPPGVDLDAFDAVDASRERRPEDPVRILFVGGDFARKGGPSLVDTFVRRVAQTGAELHLVTGDAAVPAHPQVVVHRGVTAYTPEWRELYRRADVFALPTRYEAFGMAYVEAMAAGLPVVGSAVEAIPEIVLQNETGFLVAPGDEEALAERLLRLVGDGALRQRLGSAGRRRVAVRFDGRTNAQRLASIFSAVGTAPV